METPLSVRVRGKIKGQIKDNTSQDLIISSCKRVLKVLPKSVLYLSQNCSKCTVAVSFYSFNCEASLGGTAGGPTLKFHEWVPTIGKKLFLLYIWCPENNWSTELSQSKTRERHCDWTHSGKREKTFLVHFSVGLMVHRSWHSGQDIQILRASGGKIQIG